MFNFRNPALPVVWLNGHTAAVVDVPGACAQCSSAWTWSHRKLWGSSHSWSLLKHQTFKLYCQMQNARSVQRDTFQTWFKSRSELPREQQEYPMFRPDQASVPPSRQDGCLPYISNTLWEIGELQHVCVSKAQLWKDLQISLALEEDFPTEIVQCRHTSFWVRHTKSDVHTHTRTNTHKHTC